MRWRTTISRLPPGVAWAWEKPFITTYRNWVRDAYPRKNAKNITRTSCKSLIMNSAPSSVTKKETATYVYSYISKKFLRKYHVSYAKGNFLVKRYVMILIFFFFYCRATVAAELSEAEKSLVWFLVEDRALWVTQTYTPAFILSAVGSNRKWHSNTIPPLLHVYYLFLILNKDHWRNISLWIIFAASLASFVSTYKNVISRLCVQYNFIYINVRED